MRPSRYGNALRSLESCGSTNDEARQWASSGAPDGAVVTALQQTKGRGRMGRSWVSDGENLYLSVIARPALQPAQLPVLSLLVGLSIAESLDEFLSEKAMVKWPNDVLVQGRKISGVLLELSVLHGRCEFVIIGVGVNVNQSKLPEEIADIATSMSLASQKTFDLSSVLWSILAHIESSVESLVRGEVELLLARWRARSATLGREVRVSQQGGDLFGFALDIDKEGALLLRDQAGNTQTIIAGDVIAR